MKIGGRRNVLGCLPKEASGTLNSLNLQLPAQNAILYPVNQHPQGLGCRSLRTLLPQKKARGWALAEQGKNPSSCAGCGELSRVLVPASQLANQPYTRACPSCFPGSVASSSTGLLVNSFPETSLSDHNLQEKENFPSNHIGENGNIFFSAFSIRHRNCYYRVRICYSR